MSLATSMLLGGLICIGMVGAAGAIAAFVAIVTLIRDALNED